VGRRDGLGRWGNLASSPVFDLQTVQPVARRYTDYAIPDLHKILYEV